MDKTDTNRATNPHVQAQKDAMQRLVALTSRVDTDDVPVTLMATDLIGILNAFISIHTAFIGILEFHTSEAKNFEKAKEALLMSAHAAGEANVRITNVVANVLEREIPPHGERL